MERNANDSILIRCDASLEIGYGHLTRMLTLTDALHRLQPNLTVTFAMVDCNPQIREKVAQVGAQLLLMNRELQAADVRPYDLLIVDHYDYSSQQFIELRRATKRIMLVDDFMPQRVTAEVDIVLNPNVAAEQYGYPNFPQQIRLLGATYALLRPQFYEQSTSPFVVREQCRRVMICFGGGDAGNQTLQVLMSLERCAAILQQRFEVTVVLGAENPHQQVLATFARESLHLYLDLRRNVINMAQLMKSQDLLLIPASTLALEGMCLGIPCGYTVTAVNQQKFADAMQSAGIALNIEGDHTLLSLISDYEVRRQLSAACAQNVRADGALEVATRIAHILEHDKGESS